MSSAPDKLSHELRGLWRDIQRAWDRQCVYLWCDCGCHKRYNALRYLWIIPKHLLKYRLNPVDWMDKILWREHLRIQAQLTNEQQYQQQKFESYVLDRDFLNAGICMKCQQGRLWYPHYHLGRCFKCGWEFNLGEK